MTDIEPEEDLPPIAHVTIVYTGPVAPHWDLRVRYGEQTLIDDFWARVNARLLLLPKHDPQFRRNKERVNRDAERERITCDWDLGEDDADTVITPVAEPVPEPVDQPVAEEAVAEEAVEVEPVAEEAVEVEPVAEEAAAPEPVAEEAVAEEAAAPEPVAVESVEESPAAVEEPAAEV